jgi:hypothetical protein
MVADEGIYLRHERARLGQRGDGALVVLDLVVRERAALAVFEPLLGHLIAANAELPDGRRDAVEVLLGVDVNAACRPGFVALRLHRQISLKVRLHASLPCFGDHR